MPFERGNKLGRVPKAGKGTGRKPAAVTLAKGLEMEGLVAEALELIRAKIAGGDVATARWVYEQARGKARLRAEEEREIVVRVLEDGE